MTRSAVRILLSLSSIVLFACGPSGPTSPPSIVSFTASSVVPGGGNVTLSWVQANATSLSIDNGVGDVSSQTQVTTTISATTTYTLTATNSLGSATKQVTVTVEPACMANVPSDQPFAADTTDLANVYAYHLTQDESGIALAYGTASGGSSALVWNHGAWKTQAISTGGSHLVFGSVGATFDAFASLATGVLSYSQNTDGSFAAGQAISGMPADPIMAIGANSANGDLGVVAQAGGLSTSELIYGELASGVWSTENVTVGGSPAQGWVLGTGFASDGTAWIVTATPSGGSFNNLNILRRTGAAWSVTATTSSWLANGQNFTFVAAPSGNAAILGYSQSSGASFNEIMGYVDIVGGSADGWNCMETTITGSSPAVTGRAAFNADGSAATYTLATTDGQAWTGDITGSTTPTPSGAEQFHPELAIIGGGVTATTPTPFYNACGNASIIYQAKPDINDPGAAPLYVQAL